MKCSERRVLHFASLVLRDLWKEDVLDYSDEDMALRVGRSAAGDFFELCENIDKKVIGKINSLQRKVTENSDEWNTLYEKYYDEQLFREGLKE